MDEDQGGEVPSEEQVGRLLFGRPMRMQFGIWVANLPNDPHFTFTQSMYWDWCVTRSMPGNRKSVRTDLNRFEALDMVIHRLDIDTEQGYRLPRKMFWTKRASPLWEILRMTEAALGELGHERRRRKYRPSPGRLRLAERDLRKLAHELEEDIREHRPGR